MQIMCRFAAVLAALALCAPGVAAGQTSTIPDDGAGVSTQPPVQLGGDDPDPERRTTESSSSTGELPNTGSDPRLLLLTGLALLLSGVGLRLRTADAELY